MIFQLSTTRPMDEIQAELESSAARNKFGIIAVHDLPQIMARKNVSLDMECRVYEICNPHQAKRVLEAEPMLSSMLPCRISVYGTPGSYTLATMLPSAMMESFDNAAITAVVKEVEAGMVTMMQDAAGPR
jgi:uncharacterized protein (DUF302 family)